MPPALILLICILALVVAGWALVQVNILSARHAAKAAVIDTVTMQLEEIRQDGKRNTDLLYTLVKGHVARGD